MPEQFINLGTAAVLDAKQLSVGQYTEIDGQVLKVTRIVDDLHVYFAPVTGRELWMYRWQNLSGTGQILLGVTTGFVLIVLWWLLK